MFPNVREDYDVHGRSLMNRAFWAMLVYRYGVWTLKQKFPPWRWLVSKIYGVLKLMSDITTHVAIEAQMKVGRRFHLIHVDGPVSIHPGAVIGDRCGIMHNVTIGTNMGPGAPVIGDDVFIGVGACVLGEITIADRVRISANTLVTSDVPPDSIALGVPARIFPRLPPMGPVPEPE